MTDCKEHRICITLYGILLIVDLFKHTLFMLISCGTLYRSLNEKFSFLIIVRDFPLVNLFTI